VSVVKDADSLRAERAAAGARLVKAFQAESHTFIRIPRRPAWSKDTTAEQLDLMERDSFLEWRRGLAKIQENENITMTPFEKNLEVWRQLWRVIERSHVVVQIVDARDPLLFLSRDLINYVKEVHPKKRNVLLVNKADFLSDAQRSAWREYFCREHIDFVFWSAEYELERLKVAEAADGDESGPIADDAASAAGASALPAEDIINRLEELHLPQRVRQALAVGNVSAPSLGDRRALSASAPRSEDSMIRSDDRKTISAYSSLPVEGLEDDDDDEEAEEEEDDDDDEEDEEESRDDEAGKDSSGLQAETGTLSAEGSHAITGETHAVVDTVQTQTASSLDGVVARLEAGAASGAASAAGEASVQDSDHAALAKAAEEAHVPLNTIRILNRDEILALLKHLCPDKDHLDVSE
jgi:hypothetical protein